MLVPYCPMQRWIRALALLVSGLLKGHSVIALNFFLCALKLFAVIINVVVYKASVFITVSHFHPSLFFANRAVAHQSGAPHGVSFLG